MNEPSQPEQLTSRRNELVVIWTAIIAEKATVLLMTVVGLLLAIVYLKTADFTYSAELTVIPTQTQGDNVSQRFGDLASLAGVNLGRGQSVSPFVLYSAAIRSRAVADAMSRNPAIMRRAFRGQWDDGKQQWRHSVGVSAALSSVFKGIIGIPQHPWHPPGGYELANYIQQRVNIVEDPKKSTITLSFNDTDPEFAAQFLEDLHRSTDAMLRRATLDRASKYAAYIEGKLATVQLTELRQVLTQNLSQQETLLMMGSSDAAFAAQPLGPAESSTQPTSPKPLKIMLVGIVLGTLLGCVLVVYKISAFERLGHVLRAIVSSVTRTMPGTR